MFQVVIWKEPALLAIGHLPIFYEKSGVVMQDSDMRDKRVLRTTIRVHSEAPSRIDRIVYFSIVGDAVVARMTHEQIRPAVISWVKVSGSYTYRRAWLGS